LDRCQEFLRIQLGRKRDVFGSLDCPSGSTFVMNSGETEGNGVVRGVKPACSESEGSTCSFKDIEKFPKSSNFAIAIPMEQEDGFLSTDSIFENRFNFSSFLA